MPFHVGLPAAVALVTFAAISVIIGAAMAGAGGWRALAERFPASALPPADEERFRFASVRTAGGLIGMATYEGCVTVGVSPVGISLALWAPFRLFHPPLLIPWAAVGRCQAMEGYVQHSVRLTVQGAGSLTVYGRAAGAISRQAVARGPRPGPAAGPGTPTPGA